MGGNLSGWKLTKVVSGGQCGADQAGISAAKFLNYETGGRCPKGFLTELGAEPWLAEFGLKETSSPGYRSRTYANMVDSDGTLIFTPGVLTWGTKQERKTLAKQARAKKAGSTLPNRSPAVADILKEYGFPQDRYKPGTTCSPGCRTTKCWQTRKSC